MIISWHFPCQRCTAAFVRNCCLVFRPYRRIWRPCASICSCPCSMNVSKPNTLKFSRFHLRRLSCRSNLKPAKLSVCSSVMSQMNWMFHPQFCNSMNSMTEYWWAATKSDYFLRLINIFKQVVVHIISLSDARDQSAVLAIILKISQVTKRNFYLLTTHRPIGWAQRCEFVWRCWRESTRPIESRPFLKWATKCFTYPNWPRGLTFRMITTSGWRMGQTAR